MDGQDYKARFSELAARYTAENVQIWQRYAEAIRRFSSGQGGGARPQAQMTDFVLNEGSEFVRNLMQLSLNYYSILLDMSLDFTNRLLDQVFQPPHEPASPEPAPPPRPSRSTRFELAFSGQTGEIPSSPFVVHNKKDEAAEVSFEITEFISEDGATHFRVPVEFVPDQFVLEPGAEKVIQCRVPLEPDFVPGRRYMALVRVTDFPGMEIGLIVTPQASAPGEPQLAESAVTEKTLPSEQVSGDAKTQPVAEKAPPQPRRKRGKQVQEADPAPPAGQEAAPEDGTTD